MPHMIITAVDSINLSVSVLGLVATVGYFAYRLRQTDRTLTTVDQRLQEHTTTMQMEQEKLSTVRADLNARSYALNHLGNRVTLMGVEVNGLREDTQMIKEGVRLSDEDDELSEED